ncbi:MAG: glycosyltransferase family 39 protein [Ignavibacteria bacterium]|nr:glycosyltransferase family 39 protein [Ignavibacteria bacterium]
MTTYQRIFGCCIILILLLPTLFFPLGADHFTFLRGGELVVNGGRMYVDYYDVKPPLIFYMFGIVGNILGFNELALRSFDLFWQVCTAFSLVIVVSRLVQNQILGFCCGAMYALSYTSLNFTETLQCEGFAGIGIIWLIYFQISSKNTHSISRYIVQGVALGWITALKFPLGILFFAIIIEDLLSRQLTKKKLLTKWTIIVIGMIFTMSVLLAAYFDSEVLSGYRRISVYLAFYASNPPVNFDFIRTSIKSIAEFFGDNYSLALMACIAGTIFSMFSEELLRRFHQLRSKKLILFSILVSALLLLSVVIERKLLPYRFSRMYIPLSILSGIGVVILYQEWWKKIPSNAKNLKLLASMIVFFIVIFSPLPRWLNVARFGCNSIIGNTYTNSISVQNSDPVSSPRVDVMEVTRYIKSQPIQGKTFAISTVASFVYYFLDEKPISKFISPTMYYSIIAPKGMKSEMQQEVKQATWLIVQTNDRHPSMYGHSNSSSEMLASDSIVSGYVQKNFIHCSTIGVFKIYKKNTIAAIH